MLAKDDDFTAYVERRGAWLGRCAYLLTRDREAALDLVQDTLLRAWRARDRVAAADDPERYLMRIMLNLHRDRYRRRRLSETSVADPPEWPIAAPAGDIADAQSIASALAILSERQRAVVVLRYWADYDDQRIADVLGCRRATVRSLAARALHKLEPILEER